jgi:small subunit ribosomal protein S17
MAVKEKIGIVVSDKMSNTCIVAVSDRIVHKRYKKVITRTKRYAVHDAELNASMGDQVRIRESRPISKTKNWVLINVLRKSST